jgi:hypothetical protein
MTKKITMILFALSLAACAKIDADKDKLNTKFKDTTDTKPCGGLTPIGQSILNKSWIMQRTSESGVVQDDKYSFSATNVKLVRTCKIGSVQATLEVLGSASTNSDSVQFLSNESKSVELKFDDTTYTCEASFQAQHLIRYSFMGTCLSITDGIESHFLLPQ